MKKKIFHRMMLRLMAVIFLLFLLPVSSEAASIPTTARVYNGHSYKLYDKPMSWTKAKAYCEKLGGHLVTITSKGEKNFVVKQLSGCASNWYWIGLRMKSGSWTLVTGGKAKYFNWASGEPSRDGDYGMLYGKETGAKAVGTWNDMANAAANSFYALANGGFICEWDTVRKGVSRENLTLYLGKSSTLQVTGVSGTVKWSSTNKKVATVSSKGVVKAVSPGTTTIKAKVGGKTYTCKVTVKNNNAKANNLKFKTSDGGMFISRTSKATISFKLSKTCANVKVSVKTVSGTTVYTKTYTSCTAGKNYSFTWNGKKKNGNYASVGTYVVTVKAGSTTTTSSELIIRANEFAAGTGSKSNPFQVKTFAQLKNVEKYNGYYFKQIANINCGYATFAGMFSDSAPFTGTYNGNGKTISNLFLANTSTDHVALFDVVDASGVVKNLKLSKINVTGNKQAAVLVRKNYGKVTKCTFDNCSVSSSISSGDVFNGIAVQENTAGATVTGCTVTSCTASASSGWYHIWSGGIVGHNNGNMMDCTIKGSVVSVTSRSYGWTHGGGLAAYNGGNMINCLADGVTIEEQSGNCAWSGGIVSENTGYISGCSFVNGTAANTGVELQNGTYIA